MEPHQQRVIEEKKELDEKIQKLDTFLQAALFDNLPMAEKDRLIRQEGAMKNYSEILGERIAAFQGTSP